MRFQFVLSEIGIGLRRNLTMTVAVVISVAVSLTLLGVALLLRGQVDVMKGYWYDKVEVSVFLCTKGDSNLPSCEGGDVTPQQTQQIKTDLEKLKPVVKQLFFENQQQAYERFQEQFKDEAIADTVTADQLPQSFRVKLADPRQYEIVASAFSGRPGVARVEDQRKILEPLFKVFNAIGVGALVLAIFVAIAALLLIINTVRVAAFSRRRETGIMRLVGASNFYIQMPFMLEGAIAGAVGAGLASLLVALAKYVGVDRYLEANFAFTPFVGWDRVAATVPWLFIVGVGVSALISVITLRRYLRV
jgi:cell division transport system permease protein